MKTAAGRPVLGVVLAVAFVGVVFLTAAGRQGDPDVKRGEYLVNGTGCGDCHTPKNNGPSGPESDKSRLLAGHPQTVVISAPPKPPESPWGVIGTADLTAWSGPWGVSFAWNLTPDKETGLGSWTARVFVDSIHSGRVMGKGRQILPPMPYDAYQTFTDDDLQAMFGYLQSLKPVANKVPDPLAPLGQTTK
jgi:mono/diheme cytochrome c family protein